MSDERKAAPGGVYVSLAANLRDLVDLFPPKGLLNAGLRLPNAGKHERLPGYGMEPDGPT